MNGSATTARTNVKIAAELLHAGDHAWMPTPERNGFPTTCAAKAAVPYNSMDRQCVWAAGPMTGGQRVTPHPS